MVKEIISCTDANEADTVNKLGPRTVGSINVYGVNILDYILLHYEMEMMGTDTWPSYDTL